MKITIDLTERGRNGGKARARNLSDRARKAIAKRGAAARWKRYYEQNPDKRKIA